MSAQGHTEPQGATQHTPRRLNKHAVALIALHVLLLVYSLSGFFSKNAAKQEFLSPQFIGFYAGLLAILVVYALGWQQILKRLPLTVAFANKAVTIVWGIIWGAVFFGEQITLQMIVGAAIVIVGVVLFSLADGKQQAQAAAATNEGDAPLNDAGEAQQ